MKIVLLKDSGKARTIQCTGRQLALACSLMFVLFIPIVTAFAVAPALTTQTLDERLVAEWQAALDAQRSEVALLRETSDAQAQAVGRQLARMQARLLRMEALGARVTEVANLDEGEFSFDEPVALGGPAASRESPLAWTELQSRLDTLAISLRDRETELEVLHSLLRDQEYQQGTAVSGRPVTWGWISSGYGKRVDPFSGGEAWHAGVDFAGREGSETIAVASGVVTFAGKRAGYGNLLTFDMGGTSTDVSVVTDGRPQLTHEFEIDGLPVRVPVIDIHTIGAGGGSIVWIDDGGMLRVGPRSAGALPGPACYGRGGTEPTLTDAHIIRQTVRADAFLRLAKVHQRQGFVEIQDILVGRVFPVTRGKSHIQVKGIEIDHGEEGAPDMSAGEKSDGDHYQGNGEA